MRDIVGSKAQREHQQRAQGKSNGSKLSPSANVWQTRQDANEVDVAESADEQWDAEQHNAQLQAYWQQNTQLCISKLLIAHIPRRWACPSWVVVWQDIDNAKMDHGECPEEDGGHHSIDGSSSQGMLDGKSNSQIPLHTYCSEKKCAIIDGHIEDEARQRAQEVRHVPVHAIDHLLHLKGKEEKE